MKCSKSFVDIVRSMYHAHQIMVGLLVIGRHIVGPISSCARSEQRLTRPSFSPTSKSITDYSSVRYDTIANTISRKKIIVPLAMLSEVVNALFLTYLATEYLVSNQESHAPLQGRHLAWRDYWQRPRYLMPSAIVLVINVVERLSIGTTTASRVLHQFLHIPKILFAAASYVLVLYYDCRRVQSSLAVGPFLRQVGWAFLYVLPVYPFLAVLISFGFLLVINVFEFLHLDEQILNMPIYYGVMYGPFSFVYWRVKEKMIQERNILPFSSTVGGRVLGTT